VIAYTSLWEFIVEPEQVEEFERHYGSEGSWVALFRQAPGYIQTLFLRDSMASHRFVTIDRWESADAHRNFPSAFSVQYADLDRRCERLTTRETLLGHFDEPTV
jgi:heme-degrading monooxygenase HmoA